jgi:hypothetical protein
MAMVQEQTITIEEQYIAEHPQSRELYQRGRAAMPGGIAHDIRYAKPFPIYIEQALGSKKWDVDGHEIIDYTMGHGALLLGHSHPEIVDAVVAQMRKGTHYGAGHRLEVEWAEWIHRLVPSAERVKFTSAGTEATMLALRLARAYTGRDKILKFAGHFHGWHDYAERRLVLPRAGYIALCNRRQNRCRSAVELGRESVESERAPLTSHDPRLSIPHRPQAAGTGTTPSGFAAPVP